MKHAAAQVVPREEARIVMQMRKADLQGRFGLVGLIDLLQLVELGGQDVRLEVVDPNQTIGTIRLHGGMLLEVVYGNLSGSEALLALLQHREGEFSLYRSERVGSLTGEEIFERIGPLLLESLRLEDELARFTEHRLPPEQPLSLKGFVDYAENPVGPLFGDIVTAIQDRPGITQEHLQRTMNVAPQRIQLAVAWLNSRDYLELAIKTRPSAQFGIVSDNWLSRLVRWKQGKLRLLVACPSGVSTRAMEQEVKKLQKALSAAPYSFDPTIAGPSFVRLRPALGGVVSITFLPMSHKHRFLFQTLVQGVDLALVPDDLGPAEKAEMLAGVPDERVVFFPPNPCPTDLMTVLQAFAVRQLSLQPIR